MALTKEWARARVAINGVPRLGNAGSGPGNTDVAFTGPNSPPTSFIRSVAYLRVATRWQRGVGVQPPNDWWESGQVTLSYTWTPDGSAPVNPNEMGEADPPAVSLGFAQLYPEVISNDNAANEVTVLWTLRPGVLELNTGRRTDSGPSPKVTASIWTLDGHGVFFNAGSGYAVTHYVFGYLSLLFGNQF